MRVYLLIWTVMVVLLAVNVAASFAPLGAFNLVVSLSIAVVKAALIFWFYMHLQRESGLVRLVGLGAVAWLLILVGLTASDLFTRTSW